MGCGASGPSASSTGNPATEPAGVKRKFRMGNPNYSVLGADVPRDKIVARAVFEYGKSTVFLLTCPAALEQARPFPTDAPPAAPGGAEEGASGADDAVNESGEQQTGEDSATAAATNATVAGSAMERPQRVRWAVYNDGKPEVKLVCTFFNADDIQVLDSAATVEDRKEGGRLVTEIDVPSLKTVAFVEGPIGGYMWKCTVNIDGTYENAASCD